MGRLHEAFGVNLIGHRASFSDGPEGWSVASPFQSGSCAAPAGTYPSAIRLRLPTYLLKEVGTVTVTISPMHAGKGYEYLLRTVAAGDGDRSLRDPLTRYYTEEGNPPGWWIGSGVASLASELKVGDEVTEEHLKRLIGHGQHPVTGAQLGSRYRTYAQPAEGKRRQAVAGFDMTFSIPKSASILWAVSDAGTQAIIANAHHQAITDAVDFLEREVVATRAGAKGPRGSVVQLDVSGVIATGFDHYDSRANDPHLHAHVVISNKVQTVRDGKWRTLDGTPLHQWTVAVSELHEAIFSDHVTRVLGVGWEHRARGRDRNPAWEIVGVPQTLVQEFAQRSAAIDAATEVAIEEYVAKHGRQPARKTINKLRQTANLTTRPPKHLHSLADLTGRWRDRASDLLGLDASGWARNLLGNTTPQRALRADDIPLNIIEQVGSTVVVTVGEKRSTWRRANLYAETSRQILHWRFASTQDREAVTGMIVDAAERGSLRLTPPELATTPELFTREDGTSRFRPQHSTVFSAEHLLAAEDRLLKRARITTAPMVDIEIVDAITARPVSGHQLSDEQAQAIAKVAVSGRQLDVLVGPAGAGKTTALRALKNAWTQAHGKGSVVGLAPSAAAAAVLAEELGIGTENTAKWLHDFQHGSARFTRGQLVIVDEATLAGTLTLDRITAHAEKAGAKVLLVGDWAQLQAVEAGGAFGMLVEARGDAPELVDIHRFTHSWEKSASLDLRHGHPEVIDTYLDHQRIDDGTPETMQDKAYAAWRADIDAGRASILIADNHAAVRDLNIRAQADRHPTSGQAVRLVDGTQAGVGDWIITRQNDRRLRALRNGWVRNGDRWTIKDIRADGSVVVRRQDRPRAGGVVLPAAYVAEHVDLGYAITAHRAQGVTVDTAHVVVTEATTRENLYVAMTRGREQNHAYVITHEADEDHGAPDAQDAPTAKEVLTGVLANSGAELSATQTIKAEQETWGSIAQLAAELETLATAAQRDRWAQLLMSCGLTDEQRDDILASDAYGPLAAEFRRAEANGHNIEAILPRAVARYGLDDADDIAAVLRHRLRLATAEAGRSRGRRSARMIVGLIPEPMGPMSSDMRQAINERKALIEQRARALAVTAVKNRERWVEQLGEPSVDRAHWLRNVTTIAAYRDRHGITSHEPLGGQPASDNQRVDRARAEAALRRLRGVASPAPRADQLGLEAGLGR